MLFVQLSLRRRFCQPLIRAPFVVRASFSTQRPRDPLRILFCGADEFSAYSLTALNDVRLQSKEVIESINVVCKVDKPTGRGLKVLREVPIKSVASRLDLPLDQISTVTGWQPPRPNGESINLIIAVSFGLLVPPRILTAVKYGGLNVHPSLLPDLRGPAPIHWTLLHRLTHTGVTIQTLHPKHFDHGEIIAQTPRPGIPIPHFASQTPTSLVDTLGPIGAEMLVNSLVDGTFIKSSSSSTAMQQDNNANHPQANSQQRHAPKITPHDRKIDWSIWTASDILLRDRVVGPLWDDETHLTSPLMAAKSGVKQRYTYYDWQDITDRIFTSTAGDTARESSMVVDSLTTEANVDAKGKAFFVELEDDTPLDTKGARTNGYSNGRSTIDGGQRKKRWYYCFRTVDNHIVSPRSVTIEGKPKKSVDEWTRHYSGRGWIKPPSSPSSSS